MRTGRHYRADVRYIRTLQKKENMSRKLILITYDGGPSNFLPGVDKDRVAYLRYFKSRVGGSYTNTEIIEYHNNPQLTGAFFETVIQALITRESVSSLIIVFCGHGYCTSNGNTFLLLSPQLTCSVMQLSRMCQGTNTLLITDCCRNIQVNLIKPFVLGNTFNVTFSTECGSFAMEDSNGGLYSQELIKAGRGIQPPHPSTNYSIASVHRLAALWLSAATNKQQEAEIFGPQVTQFIFSHK